MGSVSNQFFLVNFFFGDVIEEDFFESLVVDFRGIMVFIKVEEIFVFVIEEVMDGGVVVLGIFFEFFKDISVF